VWFELELLMGRLHAMMQRWRLPLVCTLLLVSLGMAATLALTAPTDTQPLSGFVLLWLGCFIPYALACLLILGTRALQGRARWIELVVIMVGALALRILFLDKDPNLSHDSWRYLWDARVTLHGYSPYVYAPGHSAVASLRDFLYDRSRFRGVPTIYPPFAEMIYVFSYLLAPENLTVLKGIFVACDLLISGLLILTLQKRNLDPARCIIYAWCPLPIVEFAMQGHVDVITVLFSVAAILCAQSQRKGFRVLTGCCIALATLVKIYPILLLLVVWKKRDWTLLLTCFGVIFLSYLPYLILGHGQVLGFFGTYAAETSSNAGPVSLLARWLGTLFKLRKPFAALFIYAVDALVMGSVAWFVFRARQREKLSMEAATLMLFGTIFAISPHIFPWYTTVLLPWVALLIKPFRLKNGALNPATIAIAVTWYFPCATLGGYFFLGAYQDWTWYYVLAYGLVLAGLGVVALLWSKQKNTLEGSV
jgi:hypothetical protein